MYWATASKALTEDAEFEVNVVKERITFESSAHSPPPRAAEFKVKLHKERVAVDDASMYSPPPLTALLDDMVTDVRVATAAARIWTPPPFVDENPLVMTRSNMAASALFWMLRHRTKSFPSSL